MASGRFELVRKSDNSIQKLKGKLSEKKEINITSLNGKAYVHLSDLKNVKEGAKFTKTNVKQVSLNMEEISVLTSYLLNIEPQVQEFLQQSEAQENSPPYQPDVRPISPPPATLPIPWGAPAPYQPQGAAAPYQPQGRAPAQYQPQTLYQQHFGAYGVPQQPTTTTYGVPGYAVQPMAVQPMMEATYNGQGLEWAAPDME